MSNFESVKNPMDILPSREFGKIPEPMSVWLHTSGERYRVILVANETSERPGEYPVTIVYRRLSDNTIWSRPFSRWYPSFTRWLA